MKPTDHKYQDPTRKDWIIGIAVLLTYVMVISVGAILLIPKNWHWWILLMTVSTILLAIRQNRKLACRCRECGHGFEVSFLVNLVAFHGVDKEGSWQLAYCPNCKKRTKATLIKVVKQD